MAMSRDFGFICASIIRSAIVLSIVLLLVLVACGKSPEPSEREGSMNSNVSPGCTGQDKLKADKVAIASFNYGFRIGRGMPVDPNELTRIQQEYAQLTPACQQYIKEIGERMQQMLDAGRIREEIDKLPW